MSAAIFYSLHVLPAYFKTLVGKYGTLPSLNAVGVSLIFEMLMEVFTYKEVKCFSVDLVCLFNKLT